MGVPPHDFPLQTIHFIIYVHRIVHEKNAVHFGVPHDFSKAPASSPRNFLVDVRGGSLRIGHHRVVVPAETHRGV